MDEHNLPEGARALAQPSGLATKEIDASNAHPGTIEAIAMVCHEANRAFCVAAMGDNSQAPWVYAPDWQKQSARNGVRAIVEGRVTQPSDSHESWMAEKVEQGWVYGRMKDEVRKTHPCLVPYADLAPNQRRKDYLFLHIVRALTEEMT